MWIVLCVYIYVFLCECSLKGIFLFGNNFLFNYFARFLARRDV